MYDQSIPYFRPDAKMDVLFHLLNQHSSLTHKMLKNASLFQAKIAQPPFPHLTPPPPPPAPGISKADLYHAFIISGSTEQKHVPEFKEACAMGTGANLGANILKGVP